ncbi:DNA-binding response regulator [Desulfonema ishimotonii]|uniref:DNA-binding response regulator n=1 Tax=Desulfonema ishimotonii TaxID=45657 RepID=A0A401FT45_9BACT|nr:response regulator transcription factor [Desulfonema ishimotonii]GBC60147.1 DNA-binding response regulator [Desulfonema ishimotonii]
MEEKEIRVLIADDHQLFREGLRQILVSLGNFTVAGEAANGQEAVDRARELKPDVVLMDINMPGIDGIQATLALSEHLPAARVIVLTMYRQDDFVFNAMRAGARGYLLKDMGADELIGGIRSVYRGNAILNPEIAGKLLDEFRRLSQGNGKAGRTEILNPGEAEVLSLLARGKDNRTISNCLNLSRRTVANRVSSILEKLRVNNRTEAALEALRRGWVSLYEDVAE